MVENHKTVDCKIATTDPNNSNYRLADLKRRDTLFSRIRIRTEELFGVAGVVAPVIGLLSIYAAARVYNSQHSDFSLFNNQISTFFNGTSNKILMDICVA